MSEDKTLNVYQRFSQACQIIDGQAWTRDLENKQYKSIPIDQMRGGVRKACVKAGIVHVGPIDLEYEHTVIDGRTHRYIGSCKFRYVNIDNPDECIEMETVGEAMDNGDKGVGKLVTNLIKNHYKAAFDIGEQDQDDVDSYSNAEFEQATHQAAARVEKSGKAAACRKAINDWISEDPMVNASSEIVGQYAKDNGIIGEWSNDVVIACYMALRKAGVKGLKEVDL